MVKRTEEAAGPDPQVDGSDADFSHLADREVRCEARWFQSVLMPDVELHLLPATEQNVAYWTWRLRVERKLAVLSSNQTGLYLKGLRQNDRIGYAEHVCVGWRVKNRKGQPVPFSKESCKSFFQYLPAYAMDEVRAWASSPRNFGGESEEALEELAGN